MQETERALRHLIKRYTKQRDWVMVATMFYDLGRLYTEQEIDRQKELANASRV